MSDFVTLGISGEGEITVNIDFILKIYPPPEIGKPYKVVILEAGGTALYWVSDPYYHDLVNLLRRRQ